jgi:hypothetical protein
VIDMEAKTEKKTPVEVVCKGAHGGAGLNGDPGVRFTVPSSYGDASIDGRTWWPTFEEAVAACRSKIERFPYPGQAPKSEFDIVEDGVLVTYSRGTVALRAAVNYAPFDGLSSGTDRELMRWEVTPNVVVLVPEGQGGLTMEQRHDAEACKAPKDGWA